MKLKPYQLNYKSEHLDILESLFARKTLCLDVKVKFRKWYFAKPV